MKVPKVISDANDKFGDILNYTLYYKGKIDIRVLDVVIALGMLISVGYYYFAYGLIAALQVGVLSIFILMCILWFFPSNKEMK